MERNATYYAKMKKLRKKMEKCLREPFTPAKDNERIRLLREMRELEDGSRI